MNRFTAWLFVFALWAVIFLPELGTLELRGEEGRRVRPGVEMLQSGNWVLPNLSGQPYLNKPPMINWLSGGSIGLLGVKSEFAARLPSPIFILLFVSVVILVPNRAMDLSERLLLALLFMTTLSIVNKGRQIEIEAVYVSQVGLAAYWWMRGYLGGYSRQSTWLGSAAFLALAMLTKGPLFGVAIFYAMVFFVLWSRRQFREFFRISHVAAVAVWMGSFMLWWWLAARQHSASAMASTYAEQAGFVLLGPEFALEARGEAILRSILSLFPWLFLAPLLWKRAVLNELPPEKSACLRGVRNAVFVCMLVVILIPGSVARYSMPVVPLFCMALAWALPADDRLSPAKDPRRLVTSIAFAIPVISVGLAIALGFNAQAAAVLILGIVAAVVFATVRLPLNNSTRAVAALAVLIALGALNWAIFTPIAREGRETRRNRGEEINKVMPPGETVYAYDPGNQIFLFYIREPIEYIVRPEQIDQKNVEYLLVGDAQFESAQLADHLGGRKVTELLAFDFRDRGRFRLLQLN